MTATMTIKPYNHYVDIVGEYSIELRGITLGKIDDDSIYAYQNGQCLALARAISERTGWPMIWLFSASRSRLAPEWATKWDNRSVAKWRTHHASENGSFMGWAEDFIHALVKAPNGTLFDISRSGSPQEWKDANAEEYGPCALLEATMKDMDDLLDGYMRLNIVQPHQNVPFTREFVRPVLERVGYDKGA